MDQKGEWSGGLLTLERWAKWLCWRLLGAGLVILSLATLTAFAGRWHWALDLLANGRPQFVVAAGLLASIYGISKRWKHAGGAAVLMLLNVGMMACYFPSAVEPIEPGKPVFRVVTANVCQANWAQRDYALLEPVLKASEPDLVALQEFAGVWRTLMPTWRQLFPRQSLASPEAWHHELTFFGSKRGRWTKAKRVELTRDRKRTGLELEMEWAGKTLSVLTVHSYRPVSLAKTLTIREWHGAIAAWVKRKKAMGHAVLVMGDFNCTPWMSIYRDLVREMGLKEAGRGKPFSATWMPVKSYRMMIDHVFVSDDLRVVNWKLLPDFGSDHRGIVVDLQWYD